MSQPIILRKDCNTDKSVLTFPVHLEPLQFVSKDARNDIEGDCGLAVVRDDTKQIIKTVSSDYNLVFHSDIIDAVEAVFQANNLKFEVFDIFTGGTKGNKMFINYTFPDYTIKINNEDYIPFVQVQNSYDKSLLFKTVTGLYRQICSNGLMTFRNVGLIKTRHIFNKIDLSKIAFNLNNWLEGIYVTKFKLEELMKAPLKNEFFGSPLKELAEKIFLRKKDVNQFLESSLVTQYVEELGQNSYALLNAFTDYATHAVSGRMKNFDHVQKSYANIENYFLN